MNSTPFDAGFNHAVYGIRAAAANADNFDNRKIIVAKNLLHYGARFRFHFSAAPQGQKAPGDTWIILHNGLLIAKQPASC